MQPLADALRVHGSLTVTDMRYNNLDTESATMLANLAKEQGISLCGIAPGQTEADFSSKTTGEHMQPEDAILLTADLAVRGSSLTSLNLAENTLTSDGRDMTGINAISEALKVAGSLTKILVGYNQLGAEGATTLCNALRESTVTKVQELGLDGNNIGPEGAKAVAAMAAVVGSLSKILVSHNEFGDKGTAILCDALRESKVTKVQELDLRDNYIGPEGAKAVAAMAAVVASITVTDMRYNQLDTESATMLANVVAKEKGISLCGITPEQTEANFNFDANHDKLMGPADVILLTADLAVRGSLTKVLVGGNYWGDEYTTILCDALRESKVTNVQELGLSQNSITPKGAKAVAAMAAVVASMTEVR